VSDGSIRELTKETLEPLLANLDDHPYFVVSKSAPASSKSLSGRVGVEVVSAPQLDDPPPLQVFLASGSGECLAGRYERSGEAEAWLLPQGSPIARWVELAISELQERLRNDSWRPEVV
jgi:hypothetical protein